MLLLFAKSIQSTEICPVNNSIMPLSYSLTEATLSETGRFDFYSIHSFNKDNLILKIRILEGNQLIVGQGTNLLCCTKEEAKDTVSIDSLFEKTYPVDSPLGFSTFSIFGQSGTRFVVSIDGNNPNNADNSGWFYITLIYFILCVIYLALLFVHSVLSRSKVHYDVVINE